VDPVAHLNAIRAAMRPDEGELALRMADELPMDEKIQYVNELLEMSVPEAVTFLRAKLAELRRDRGAESSAEVSDAELDAHLSAVRAALSPKDSETVQLLAEELPFELRRNYLRKLAGMSVPEAVTYVRTELGQLGRNRRAVEPRTARVPNAAPSSAALSTPPAPDLAPRTAPEMRRREGRRIAGSPLDARRRPAAATTALPPSDAPTAPVGAFGLVAPAAQHIAAIQDALSAEEDAATRAHVAALSHADRSAWVATLLLLPVPEAVAMIRAQLAADRASADTSDPSATGAGVTARNRAAPTSAPTGPARPDDLAPRDEMTATALPAPAHPEPEPLTAAPAPVAETPSDQVAVAPAPAVAPVPLAPVAPAVVRTPADASAPLAPAATPTAAPHVVDTNAHTHLAAIELALTPQERFLVHAMIAQQSPDDREVWLDQLVSRSVADGAAILRDAVRELTTPAPGIGEQPDDGQELDEGEQPDDGQELDEGEQSDDGQELDEGEPLDDGQELDESEQPDDGQDASRGMSDAARSPSAALATPAALTSAGLPTLDAAALAHFDAIQRALTLAERMRVHEIAAQRPASELRAWIVELAKLPVPDAVTRLRAALAAADSTARTAPRGGVS
jgi:hypothetical protein